MRTKILLLAMLICAGFVSAQDVITKTDGSVIKAKVEEITETVVKYRRYDNPSGPMYSIPLTSISKIIYENGAIDTLDGSGQPKTATNNVTPQMSYLNEADLYKLDEKFNRKFINYEGRAKTYRKVGWYGGGAIALIGIGIAVVLASTEDIDSYYCPIIGVSCVGAGAIWCLSWNLAANNQMKKARNAVGYSVPVVEHELFNANGKSLTASVNMMGNKSTLNQNVGLGLGLTLNF